MSPNWTIRVSDIVFRPQDDIDLLAHAALLTLSAHCMAWIVATAEPIAASHDSHSKIEKTTNVQATKESGVGHASS